MGEVIAFERGSYMRKSIHFMVNGENYNLEVFPWETLLEVLRNKIGITSPKYGCGKGECGACTVILNDEPVNSCLVLAIEIDGKRIITVEGLVKDGKLHPLQEAFIEKGAVQCGFCTPGMILSLSVLLKRNPDPSEEEIQETIAGNICRCTGYVAIVEATRHAANILSK